MEELFQKLRDYIEVRFELFKLKSINKGAGLLSASITIVILIIFFSACLMCLSVGGALLIGQLIGKSYAGFFIMGGLYLIIGLIFYSMRHKLVKTKVTNKLIKEFID